MAEIAAAITKNQDGSITVLWETLTSTNTTGSPVHFPDYDLVGVQMLGTFGAAATMAGSTASGGTYSTLEDIASVAVSQTAAGMQVLAGAGLPFIKPVVGAVTDVDIYAYFLPRV